MADKLSTFSYDVYNTSGKKISEASIKSSIVNPEDYKKVVAQAMRVYQENARQRNASTKTRSEVAGSTRKIYKQKGTGRARHGSIKAPIFVGGGVVFGPHSFNKKLTISKKAAQKAFLVVCIDKIKNKQFIAIEGLDTLKPKTGIFDAMINKIFTNNKSILFVNQGSDNIIRAGRNIKRVTLSPVATVNTHDVLKHAVIVIQNESVESLFKRLNITGLKKESKKIAKKKNK